MRGVNRLMMICRWLYWRKRFGSTNGFVKIGAKVTFKHPEVLHFGNNVSIGKYTYFLPVKSYLSGGNYLPSIIIGNNTSIGIRNSFACIDRIEIGNNVLFAGYVHITDHSHGYEAIGDPIWKQQLISKGPVVIEDDCWLGFGCEILSGVHVGNHSVVAARAVVTKNVPSYTVVAGNPARIIKSYNKETGKWERVEKPGI